ncbi:NAD(P)-dependent oxidoreductase [Sodalis sp.]|uniref:NAD(P)-dependent oxidoreductase n=1 Tax=Sodalis sp. (in: enterobacteria) TaxID=1898979 RepID=UPI0038732DAB
MAEVTFSNFISVAKHMAMTILVIVRSHLPAHLIAKQCCNIADCAVRSYDIEGMHLGALGTWRIGQAVIRRLKPFDTKLHHYDPHRLPD